MDYNRYMAPTDSNSSNFAHGGSHEHPTASSQLLDAVRNMDSVGWSRLVNTFGPIVYRWCRTSGVPESDAPDLVQEVFASVASGVAGFERRKDQGSFRSWLATITRNKVRDFYRRQRNSQSAVGGTEALLRIHEMEQEIESTICAETASALVVREVLEHTKVEFETATWNAFWMTTIDGQRASDVAAQVGISVASVYQAKSRVLRRLRERLAGLPQ